MRLYTTCSNCDKETYFNSYYPTRGDLAKAKGNEFKMRCKKCEDKVDMHVNELKAQPSKSAQILAASILIIGTPLTFWLLWDVMSSSAFWLICGGMILLPVVIFAILHKQERQRVSSFNRYKVNQ